MPAKIFVVNVGCSAHAARRAGAPAGKPSPARPGRTDAQNAPNIIARQNFVTNAYIANVANTRQTYQHILTLFEQKSLAAFQYFVLHKVVKLTFA
jgi:hypothetical protein